MRIAIVDDAEQERNQLREKLETQLEQDSIYTDITEFDNGAAFLTAAREEAFAAVFLDIYMQGKNGIETAKELRQFDTDCMLVIITTSEDHALEGFRVRAMHYLVKPYTEEELQQTVAEMLRKRNHEPAVSEYSLCRASCAPDFHYAGRWHHGCDPTAIQ